MRINTALTDSSISVARFFLYTKASRMAFDCVFFRVPPETTRLSEIVSRALLLADLSPSPNVMPTREMLGSV